LQLHRSQAVNLRAGLQKSSKSQWVEKNWNNWVALRIERRLGSFMTCLAEARRGKHDLIVMGAGRRPGDRLFFGDTAAAVFERSPTSIVFVAT
jgi:nucleotide-binding universal stress UspA family protein